MAYKIQFDERLISELEDIFFIYQSQSVSAAEKFQTAFILIIEMLQDGKIDFLLFHEDIRRAPLPDFPYIVYYSRDEEQQTVFILAVLHSKRSDEFVQRRMEDR